MKAPFQVIQGPYFEDLMDQPAALERTARWLAAAGRWSEVGGAIRSRSWKRVVLTGMGSSFHTLHPLNFSLIAAGFNVVMMETSELIHHAPRLCDAQSLIIAVSQSGGSAEVKRLHDTARGAFVLGVTNLTDGDLARKADLALFMQSGPESTVSCKTYVAGLMILEWLAALMVGVEEQQALRALEPAARLTHAYLERWQDHTEILASLLNDVRHVFLAGRGNSLAAAGTGALIVKESARLHAEGMSSAAFRHGPMEILGGDHTWLGIFSGDETTRALNLRLAEELRARGASCAIIGPESDVAPLRIHGADKSLRPLLEILPVQMMTLTLSALQGREAGRFEHASKITDTE